MRLAFINRVRVISKYMLYEQSVIQKRRYSRLLLLLYDFH